MSGGTAGVKNLRAMFENKNGDQSTSPPSRGRSPNGSISSANSRPVSKVRTSFVAVERPGDASQPSQWGLRKASDVSSMAEAREAAIMEEDSNAPAQNGSALDGPGLGAILKGSPFERGPGEPDPARTPPTPPQKRAPAETHELNGSTSKVASMVGKMQGKPQPAKPIPAPINTQAEATKPKDTPAPATKSPATQKKLQEPPAVATGPAATNGNASMIKPRGGVNKIQGILASARKAKEDRLKMAQEQPGSPNEVKKSTPTAVKPPSVASKPTAASKAHAQQQDSPSTETLLVKSPSASKPSKLPSAAMASTAASAARKDGNGVHEEPKKPGSDRRSTLGHAPRVANVTTKASLAKKSSRASLVNSEERPKSRPSLNYKPADEGFLARMTRPTASSAQKAHSKVEVNSPPRPRHNVARAPNKPGRKSLSLQPGDRHEAGPEDEATGHEPLVEGHVGSAGDEGEPGPAEETTIPSQQAEVPTANA